MDAATFPWLTTIILFPIVAALAIPLIPMKEEGKKSKTIHWYALTIGLIDFALIIYTFCTQYDIHEPGLQLVERYAWAPQIGLNWSVGADGLSMPLILLTGFIPGQEEGNVPFVTENGVGAYSEAPAQIAAILSRWFGPQQARLVEMGIKAKTMGRPQATFEIVEAIAGLLDG